MTRCDHYPDCKDYSDEVKCWLVGFPQNYEKDFAPFTRFENGTLEKVPVKIKVIISVFVAKRGVLERQSSVLSVIFGQWSCS